MIRLQLVLLVLVALLAPAAHGEAASSFPRDFTALGAASIFVATTPGHAEPTPDHTTLWRTDGSAEGTSELLLCSPACDPRPSILASSGSLALVAAFDEAGRWHVWGTDGSQAGTRKLTSVEHLGSPPGRHGAGWVSGFGRFFFAAEEAQGWSVWVSDGTATGTERLVALSPSVETEPFGFVEHEGAVYFFVAPADPAAGVSALWRSGGTPETTRQVTSLAAQVMPWVNIPAASLAEGLLFVASEGGKKAQHPWTTDGTAAGTKRLTGNRGLLDITPELAAKDGRGWFWGMDFGLRRLWVTDGTESETRPLGYHLLTAHGSFLNGPWDPFPGGRGVVFSVEGIVGLRLWTSDGTDAGTRPLCHELACLSDARIVAATADRVYFVPEDGTLWETDGTKIGTRRAAEVTVSLIAREAPPAVAAGDHLFFRGVESPKHVEQLWALERSTGTVRRLTAFLYPQPAAAGWETGVLGDRLLFGADDGANGVEPWVSDGTPAGTHRLGNLAVGDDRGSCSPHETALCLHGNRFRVEVQWDDPHNGGSGPGRAIPATGSDASGTFWFFSPDNVELIVKVLDGTPVNGFYWTFYGALTDVEYEITVTDTWTGATASYHNPPGTICGGGDTASLPGGGLAARTAGGLRAVAIPAPPAAGLVDGVVAASGPGPPLPRCVPDAETLCFYQGFFRVRVEWHDQHNGGSGTGGTLPFTDTSGFFWFFSPDNVELVVKLIDAFRVDGDFWFFYGALTDVGYTITVEDLIRGLVKRYVNPPGEICGRADTDAFPG